VVTAQETTQTRHSITVSAPAEAAYEVVADVSRWPVFFTPTIHAERVGGDDTDERIRLWAFANEQVKTWTSRRWLDPASRRVSFRQEVSSHPVARMQGEWLTSPAPGGTCDVTLTHAFAAADDEPGAVELISRAVDANSRAELQSLKAAAEHPAEPVFTFADSVIIKAPRRRVYDFIYRCQDWPERLPHVSRLELEEDVPGLQVMEMDTRSPDGTVHTTRSGRVCFPDTRIVYKQSRVPPVLSAHVGEWLFRETAAGVELTARHSVVVSAGAVPQVLGPDATVPRARAQVRDALAANSMATMGQARAWAESP
jgi:ribosome-associated toxin RatA of RatAB toxin-antitoxin module